MSLNDEVFEVDVADGTAEYRIVGDYGDGTVEVEWIPNEYEYRHHLLGSDCRISKANVERVVEWTKRWR